jgi:hypothetical protein
MRTTKMLSVGFAGALLAAAATQFPDAALALNPQPEVPSRPNPNWHKKNKTSGKTQKHVPPSPVKR